MLHWNSLRLLQAFEHVARRRSHDLVLLMFGDTREHCCSDTLALAFPAHHGKDCAGGVVGCV
jgi:hypothetical protein